MREAARVVWDRLEGQLGRERLETLFLHMAALETRTIPAERADLALAHAFDLGKANAAAGFVIDRLRTIGGVHVRMLNAGLDPGASPGPALRRLQHLGWIIRHDTWRLPALHWLQRHPLEAPETLAFLRKLEALAWVQMIKAEDVQRRDRRYLALLGEIDRGRALEPGGALAIAPDERAAVSEILKGANFFRRPYKLFLLLRLNAIYEGEDRVVVVPEATVEHVFPQSPGGRSRWHGDFGTGSEAARLRHALGNLTLLTEAEQNQAKNLEFAAKREVYRASRFALSQRLGELAAWRPGDVDRRTDALVADLFAALGIA
jgi:hypothetical protein